MRYILGFFLFLTVACGASKAPTLDQQTKALYKQLWKDEKFFGYTTIYITLQVKHATDMHNKLVWGDIFYDAGYPQIEVLALEDFPPQESMANRKKHQLEVLRHELFHIKMDQLGVPASAQDDIIEALQPLLKK